MRPGVATWSRSCRVTWSANTLTQVLKHLLLRSSTRPGAATWLRAYGVTLHMSRFWSIMHPAPCPGPQTYSSVMLSPAFPCAYACCCSSHYFTGTIGCLHRHPVKVTMRHAYGMTSQTQRLSQAHVTSSLSERATQAQCTCAPLNLHLIADSKPRPKFLPKPMRTTSRRASWGSWRASCGSPG